jgi:hypothetical protein
MDLDDFDEQVAVGPSSQKTQSAKNARRELDAQWWMGVSRSSRWMDLLGDYAGTEPFVLDGKHSQVASRQTSPQYT